MKTAVIRMVKWGGVLAVLLLVTLWAATLHTAWGWQWSRGLIGAGRSGVWGHHYAYPLDFPGGFERIPEQQIPASWRPSVKKVVSRAGATRVYIPIWMVLLPGAVVTWGVWRLDARSARRRRPGVCQMCGYDRKGLAADAVCPECGGAAKGIGGSS